MFFRSTKKDSPSSPAPSGERDMESAKAEGPPPLPKQLPSPQRMPTNADAPPPMQGFSDQRLGEIEAEPWPSPTSSKTTFGPEKQLQAAFGQIAALLSRTPRFQTMPLVVLRTAVIPAIGTGQFLIAEGKNKKTGRAGPLAAVLWAQVNQQVDERLSCDRGQLLQLGEADRKSGDIVWITLAVGKQRLVDQMIERLRATNFQGRPVKLFADDAESPITLEPH
jgi:hemolysin-activating ACP:hemolysin acyltransferase